MTRRFAKKRIRVVCVHAALVGLFELLFGIAPFCLGSFYLIQELVTVEVLLLENPKTNKCSAKNFSLLTLAYSPEYCTSVSLGHDDRIEGNTFVSH